MDNPAAQSAQAGGAQPTGVVPAGVVPPVGDEQAAKAANGLTVQVDGVDGTVGNAGKRPRSEMEGAAGGDLPEKRHRVPN